MANLRHCFSDPNIHHSKNPTGLTQVLEPIPQKAEPVDIKEAIKKQFLKKVDEELRKKGSSLKRYRNLQRVGQLGRQSLGIQRLSILGKFYQPKKATQTLASIKEENKQFKNQIDSTIQEFSKNADEYTQNLLNRARSQKAMKTMEALHSEKLRIELLSRARKDVKRAGYGME